MLHREDHTALNHLLLSRLPLALSPQTEDPTVYARGLQRFALIYVLFESVWTDIVALQPLEASQTIDHRIISALKHLYLPGLLRTQSLRSDLSILLQLPVNRVDEELALLEGPHIQGFVEHFEQACALKPHILVAYAWVFYMTLFNGGRWIRAQLLAGRKNSWSNNVRSREGASTPHSGLSFWHFPGGKDGEDIKDEFKARLVDVDGLLNAEQRQDIVDEACQIFRYCGLLVEELDGIIAARPRTPPEYRPWLVLLFSHILPMGFIELFYALVRWLSRSRWYAWVVVPKGMFREDGGAEKSE